MFRRIALSFFLCGLMELSAYGQRLPFLFSAGINYGTYSMKDMKALQKDLLLYSQANFNLLEMKSVAEFPPQLGYEASIMTSFKKWKVGLTGWRYSTGARNDYTDYTGFIRTDMITTVNGVGVKGNYTFVDNNSHHFYATVHSGIGFNSLTIKQQVVAWDFVDEKQKRSFKSQNIVVTPGAGYSFTLTNRISLGAEAKYEFNVFKGKLKASDTDAYLTNFRGEKQVLQWDGIRLSLTASYAF